MDVVRNGTIRATYLSYSPSGKYIFNIHTWEKPAP